ncbi:MAG TPA: endopeptidase La, partial [Bdellovibrionales bacterium]|nr:endopeptidase La [Bdellovibrionales bacterium]
VLDPEQNHNFQDHYLEVEYDLSPVMFITTANSLHPIPRPLLDRMEVIQLEGYTETEKFNIAKKYLIPKQLEAHGLGDYKVNINDAAVRETIRSYTREAGVRNLERQIATLCRKQAKEIVKEEMASADFKKGQKSKKSKSTYTINPKKVTEYLGPNKMKFGRIEGQNEIGLTNGLAWTEVGGDLLVVEVSVVPGKGKFTVTGQLGDVMKESCAAAM